LPRLRRLWQAMRPGFAHFCAPRAGNPSVDGSPRCVSILCQPTDRVLGFPAKKFVRLARSGHRPRSWPRRQGSTRVVRLCSRVRGPWQGLRPGFAHFCAPRPLVTAPTAFHARVHQRDGLGSKAACVGVLTRPFRGFVLNGRRGRRDGVSHWGSRPGGQGLGLGEFLSDLVPRRRGWLLPKGRGNDPPYRYNPGNRGFWPQKMAAMRRFATIPLKRSSAGGCTGPENDRSTDAFNPAGRIRAWRPIHSGHRPRGQHSWSIRALAAVMQPQRRQRTPVWCSHAAQTASRAR
jgi:hypothetical protein